jgi:heme a synthase
MSIVPPKNSGSSQNNTVMKWLYLFASVVAFLVVLGGFVRLTRSGLSIVEWNPINGAVPPFSRHQWEQEFDKYKQTPEYQQINSGMTLEEYKFIFYMEWIHRNAARAAGLVYAIPVFYFLFKGIIPLREFGVYFLMGILFIAQAFAGWFMVASGLNERPSVSHFNLAIHLMLAVWLFGLALWTAFGHQYGFAEPAKRAKWSLASKLSMLTLILLMIQITYGAFTAGLKAGHVSDTWPLMLGKLIPANLFNSWVNIFESPQTIVFIHRWFGWSLLIITPILFSIIRRQNYPAEIQQGLKWWIGVIALQIILGIVTILSHVNIVIALIHQANAIILVGLAVFFLHRFRAIDRT